MCFQSPVSRVSPCWGCALWLCSPLRCPLGRPLCASPTTSCCQEPTLRTDWDWSDSVLTHVYTYLINSHKTFSCWLNVIYKITPEDNHLNELSYSTYTVSCNFMCLSAGLQPVESLFPPRVSEAPQSHRKQQQGSVSGSLWNPVDEECSSMVGTVMKLSAAYLVTEVSYLSAWIV